MQYAAPRVGLLRAMTVGLGHHFCFSTFVTFIMHQENYFQKKLYFPSPGFDHGFCAIKASEGAGTEKTWETVGCASTCWDLVRETNALLCSCSMYLFLPETQIGASRTPPCGAMFPIDFLTIVPAILLPLSVEPLPFSSSLSSLLTPPYHAFINDMRCRISYYEYTQ